MKARECQCGRDMSFGHYRHVTRVGAFDVVDELDRAHSCACGAAEVSMSVMLNYERRSVRAVLARHPDAGGVVYKFARKALGRTQSDVANTLGVAVETLSRWETDAAPMPRAVQLALLALLADEDEVIVLPVPPP